MLKTCRRCDGEIRSSEVSIPHRYAENVLIAVCREIELEVSIPHRYAENSVANAQVREVDEVSIPHRYAENAATVTHAIMSAMFQSLIGMLKTDIIEWLEPDWVLFQSLIGMLKTFELWRFFIELPSFNPS